MQFSGSYQQLCLVFMKRDAPVHSFQKWAGCVGYICMQVRGFISLSLFLLQVGVQNLVIRNWVVETVYIHSMVTHRPCSFEVPRAIHWTSWNVCRSSLAFTWVSGQDLECFPSWIPAFSTPPPPLCVLLHGVSLTGKWGEMQPVWALAPCTCTLWPKWLDCSK